MSGAKQRIQSFSEFYLYYLREHNNQVCRTLHYIGTSGVIIELFLLPYIGAWEFMWIIPVTGYGFAWIGHAFFERNKPATFRYPLWSLGSDFVMFWHLITGKIAQKRKESQLS
jgi:hypothetical protein